MQLQAVLDPFVTSGVGYDGLRLGAVPFVPEVLLHLADDAIVLRARLEARAGRRLPPPFWADAWVGGCAVARYVLDHPEVVAGRRVLDVASGSGVAAIAAAIAGAAAVTANDIDPYALAAIILNAKANAVRVDVLAGDLLAAGTTAGTGGTVTGTEVVLAGDVFYSQGMAGQMLTFLQRATARGADVLVGDPGREHLPGHWLETVAGYRVASLGAFEDAQVTQVRVLRPAPGQPDGTRGGDTGSLIPTGC